MWIRLLSVTVFGVAATAAPLLTINAPCCGTLTVDFYEKYLNLDDLRGGVGIEANWTGKKPRSYHFLSAVTTDTKPPAYADGTALPIPYADTPPGGYKGSKGKINDYLPWYPFESGTGKAKHFEDQPANSFFDVVTLDKDGNVTASRNIDVFFETWLVCVIKTKGETSPTKGPAKNVSYTVAPLAGFTWGFTLSWSDKNDDKRAQLGEFDSTLQGLTALATPSANMIKAFSKATEYGKKKDYFDVTFAGSCKDCEIVVPEPLSATYILLGFGLILIQRLRAVKRRV